MWKAGIVLVYLLMLSLWDSKECRVPVLLLAAGSIFTGNIVIYELLVGHISWLEPLLGSLPGVFLLVAAWLTGKAGYADGIVLLWLGILQGYREGLLVFGVSLLLISLASVALLMLRKVKKYTRIPYIPFLTAAFVFVNLVC